MNKYQLSIRDLFENLIKEAESEVRPLVENRFQYEVSLHDVKTNSDIVKPVPIENTYLLERKKLIPIVISDILGDYVNLKGNEVVEGSMVAQLLIPTDKRDINNTLIEETFQNVSDTIYQLIKNGLGKTYPLGETRYYVSDEYSVQFDEKDGSVLVEELEIKFKYISAEGSILTSNATNSFRLTVSNEDLVLSPFGIVLGTLEEGKTYELKIEKDNNDAVVYLNGEVAGEVTDAYNTIEAVDFYRFQNFMGELEYIVLNGDTYDELNYIGEFGEDWIVTPNNTETLFESGSQGNITFDFTLPNPIGNQFTMGEGLNYQNYSVEIGITVTKDIFMGNQARYFIDGVEVYPFMRSHGVGSEPETSQLVGKETADTVINDNSITKEFTLYYKPNKKIIELMKHIVKIEEQNKTFELKEVYPFFTTTKIVVITDGGLSPISGSPFTYSFSVVPAWEGLNE